MNPKRIFLKSPIREILTQSVMHTWPRKIIFDIVDKRFHKLCSTRDLDRFPQKIGEDKYCMIRNMIRTVERALQTGQISNQVWSRFIKSFTEIPLKESAKLKAFEKEYGFSAPDFITVSPYKSCNLKCQGCYADSQASRKEKLAYPILSRIIQEQKQLWGSHFTVISGGEPLLYKSEGKNILDLAGEHHNTFFLMYTNGTLIDKAVAQRFAEMGNITPAISVEGFEEETDRRRGQGVFQKILEAFASLREVGVPYGISLTATKDNADLIMRDELIDFYFREQGALYGWIFQYMPIGRSYTLHMMVSPEQRVRMYRKTWELIRERGLFLADFWNSAATSSGCISAGRGYLYIDWNGNVMPCVFNPYTVHNIKDVFAGGGNLNTVLFSPFFKRIRKWQKEYSLEKAPDTMGNILVPCAIRDHFAMMFDLIQQTSARPADVAAEEAITDESYYKGLVCYGEEVKTLTDEIWEKEYLGPEREKRSQSRQSTVPSQDFKRVRFITPLKEGLEGLRHKFFH